MCWLRHWGPEMGLRLPPCVVLPTQAHARPMTLLRSIGASKQRVARWRRSHGFPGNADGEPLDVAAVAAWFAERGTRIIWR